MTLTEKQNILFSFVVKMHGEQKRKYTGEPYVNHCLSVAKLVSTYEECCIEIALCHDLFEDTECTFDSLYLKMKKIGYEGRFSYNTCSHVKELTDVFTHKNYPHLNRKERKTLY